MRLLRYLFVVVSVFGLNACTSTVGEVKDMTRDFWHGSVSGDTSFYRYYPAVSSSLQSGARQCLQGKFVVEADESYLGKMTGSSRYEIRLDTKVNTYDGQTEVLVYRTELKGRGEDIKELWVSALAKPVVGGGTRLSLDGSWGTSASGVKSAIRDWAMTGTILCPEIR